MAKDIGGRLHMMARRDSERHRAMPDEMSGKTEMKSHSDEPEENPGKDRPAAVKRAMKHKDKPGEGAKKRKHLGKRDKVHTVMAEFKRGTLRSGSGAKVKSRKQAVAVAMSESGQSRKV